MGEAAAQTYVLNHRIIKRVFPLPSAPFRPAPTSLFKHQKGLLPAGQADAGRTAQTLAKGVGEPQGAPMFVMQTTLAPYLSTQS